MTTTLHTIDPQPVVCACGSCTSDDCDNDTGCWATPHPTCNAKYSNTTSTTAALLDRIEAAGRPNHVAHPVLEAIVAAMRSAGREELVHYAGACYRDATAWYVSLAWLNDTDATESQCLSRAYAAMQYANLSPESIRAANPGML